jgi:anti-anti-sigma factor
MAPVLESATTPSDGHAIVTVCGDIAADTALELWQHLTYLVGQGHQHIVLDLAGMVLIDSAGVEVLARVSEWTRGNGGDLELRSASPAWSSSWSWPAGPRPAATILPPAAANRHGGRRPDRKQL